MIQQGRLISESSPMNREEDFTSFERLEVTRIEYEKFEQKLTKLREFMTGIKNKNV
jgi:hypothetical protein